MNTIPEVANSLRDIFYTSSRPKAMAAYETLCTKYEATILSAVKCLGNAIEVYNIPYRADLKVYATISNSAFQSNKIWIF